MRLHLRSDVPVGAYLSGGLDSSVVAVAGEPRTPERAMQAFTGKFPEDPRYDESALRARARRRSAASTCTRSTSASTTSSSTIERVIYHLDYPVAGPGLVPAVHGLAGAPRATRKVILGGQGGDEIFGGYTRYLIAYFEQCIKAAIDGTMHSGNFVVTYESIIPNLVGAARTTSRCCRSSGATGCSRTSTRATSG